MIASSPGRRRDRACDRSVTVSFQRMANLARGGGYRIFDQRRLRQRRARRQQVCRCGRGRTRMAISALRFSSAAAASRLVMPAKALSPVCPSMLSGCSAKELPSPRPAHWRRVRHRLRHPPIRRRSRRRTPGADYIGRSEYVPDERRVAAPAEVNAEPLDGRAITLQRASRRRVQAVEIADRPDDKLVDGPARHSSTPTAIGACAAAGLADQTPVARTALNRYAERIMEFSPFQIPTIAGWWLKRKRPARPLPDPPDREAAWLPMRGRIFFRKTGPTCPENAPGSVRQVVRRG